MTGSERVPDPSRPDPDALLARVQAESVQETRGRLKIFFGFAPGVGKTFRMLHVARELVFGQHFQASDVLVGIVETHGRPETQAMLRGLEILPRKNVEYRGRTLQEFDLDAALARKPAVVVLDELAHTNAPGSRHPKRWQDAEELLAAGVSVFTTLNVQHVESLNDVIAQITGVRVRETVPDAVLERADSIELIDITPDELLERLAAGKVYLPAQARRATENFFQRGNLLALRELALRRTAEHVDEDVRAYRRNHGVSTTWPAAERIMVWLDRGEQADRLLRAAARMAAGLRCTWVAAYRDVEPATGGGRVEELESALRGAESLGGYVVRVPGTDPIGSLLRCARQQNVTRLIVGKPPTRSTRGWFGASQLDEIVRGSGEIEVLVITTEAGQDRRTPLSSSTQRPSARDYLGATAVVGIAVGSSALLRESLDLPDLDVLFVLAVMVVAVLFGRGPSLWAAALGVACYDFFFVPPFGTFSVDDRRYFLTFAMIFGVGLAVSELTGRIRAQERDALSREERTSTLYALARELSASGSADRLASIAAEHVSRVIGAGAVIWVADEEGALRVAAMNPESVEIDDKERAVAQWAFEHSERAGMGTDTLAGAKSLCSPLLTSGQRHGVLMLLPPNASPLRIDQMHFLDAVARQVAAALERARLSDNARAAALRAESESLRSSLLSAVSHDLRTPLASIIGGATALRDTDVRELETRGELLDAIVDQAERMERLVTNLLDMTSLQAGAVAPRRTWVPLEELIGAALTRLESRLGNRPIRISVDATLPWLFVDPVLIEQLFVNLFENVHKHTPRDSPLEVRGTREGQSFVVQVKDRGPGLPPGAETRIFEKFFRSAAPQVPGAGLGLAICKAVVEVHAGSIDARNRDGGGAVFTIRLPLLEPPADLLGSDDADDAVIDSAHAPETMSGKEQVPVDQARDLLAPPRLGGEAV